MNIYKEIAEKRKILREEYGGMMTLTDLTKEFGYGSKTATIEAIRELDIPATKIGRMKRYETDLVAKRLVELRGMV